MNVITSRESEEDTPKISHITLSGNDKVWCNDCGDYLRLEDLERRISDYPEHPELNSIYIICPECSTSLFVE